MYDKIINAIDPTVNARHVEAWMRTGHGTLNHLSREDFAREIEAFRLAIERYGFDGEACAKSWGL